MQENIPSQVCWVSGDVRYLCFKDNTFDAIVNLEVLEHLPNYLEDVRIALRESYRVLKPKGILITEVPLKLHYYLSKISLIYPWNWFKKPIRNGLSIEEYITYFIKSPLYIDNLFWRKDIEKIFKSNGFYICRRKLIQVLQAGYHKRIPIVHYLENYFEKTPFLNECAKEIVWCLQKE